MEYRKIKDLVRLDKNPRKIRDKQLSKLMESIKENKQYFEARPIILSDRTGELVVIAGNQRLEAATRLDLKEVPTFLMSGLTIDKEQEIIIRDNVTNGDWDYTALAEWDNTKLIDWGVDIFPTFNGDIDAFFEDNTKEAQKAIKQCPHWSTRNNKCKLDKDVATKKKK